MQSAVVVIAADKVFYVVADRLPTRVCLVLQPLVFECPKDPLDHSVVPAVSTSAHTLADSPLLQCFAESDAGVLASLIGVKKQTGGHLTLFASHVQSRKNQCRIGCRRATPADN